MDPTFCHLVKVKFNTQKQSIYIYKSGRPTMIGQPQLEGQGERGAGR